MRIHRPLDFWASDRGLTRVLALLVVAIFVILPVAHLIDDARLVLSAIFAGIVISGLQVTGMTAYVRAVGYVAAIAAVLVQCVALFGPMFVLDVMEAALGILALSVLNAVILFRVFHTGPIDANRIKGAIAAYLVLGVIFAHAYQLVELLAPGSLMVATGAMAPNRGNISYFSFVTLTTVGYGDIYPTHPISRSLATAEALIGQLYPAIFIGRLISIANWESKN